MKKTHPHFISATLVSIALLLFVGACGFLDNFEEVSDEENAETGASSPSFSQGPIAVGESEPDTWLVMLYQDADDETLERDIFLDFNEAEIIGSTDRVRIVSQLDRYDGSFDGDGDWTSTKRFFIEQDYELETIASEELEDLGEVDMSDSQSLYDFMIWGIQSYPSEHYVLILSDHGMGWLGGWTDPEPYYGEMSLSDIDGALSAVLTDTGIGQLELLGFDACLMAQLETLSMAAPFARYAVASEETEPSVGWAYAAFLGELTSNPSMSGADLAVSIVDSYITDDYRITDDEARISFIEENYEYGENMSAREVAEDMSGDITLAAFDLSKVSALNDSVNELVTALPAADQSAVAASRSYAQSFTSVFEKGIPDSFLDLGHFTELLSEETGDADVVNAAKNVSAALSQTILAEKHGDLLPGATGLAFYFPNSELYEMTTDEDFGSYTSIANRFAAASLWDDFLAYHYTGKEMDLAAVDLAVLDPIAATQSQDFSEAIAASAPEEGVEFESPGRGEISISEVTSTAYEINVDESATISAYVSGTNIAYLYYYVNYYAEEYDSFLMADVGYLNADSMKEVGGSIYPDWDEGEEFLVEYNWLPTVYYLSDGEKEAFVYLEPELYGETYEEDVYTLYGLYAPGGDTDKEQEAMIRFDGNFEMKSFWVFTGEDGTGAPREATLENGDTFTPWELWQDYNVDTEEWEYAYYLGEAALTYTGDPFVILAYDAFSGVYEVGFRAEDYDGNIVAEAYQEITVP